MTTQKPQETDFTRDVLGRYICNGLDEALVALIRMVNARMEVRKTMHDLLISS